MTLSKDSTQWADEQISRRNDPDLPVGLRSALIEYGAFLQRVGSELNDRSASDAATIERFAHQTARDLTTARVRRWTLRDHFLQTCGSLRNANTPRQPMRELGPATRPYSRSDETTLIRTVSSVRAPGHRRAVLVALVAGLGAGLARRDIEVCGRDQLWQANSAWWISRPCADVPVRRLVEPLVPPLVDLIAAQHGEGLLPRPMTVHLVTRQPVGGVRIDYRRLRATWIVRQLESGTTIPVLLDALGMDDPRWLWSYGRHVAMPSESDRVEMLRGR